MRLPRKFSISNSSEFECVRKNGRSKSGHYIVISVVSLAELEHFKYGLITTKKVGKAHQRNYLRRVFRSILQKNRSHISKNHLIVTIARWRAIEASYGQLETEWLKLARKLKIIEKST